MTLSLQSLTNEWTVVATQALPGHWSWRMPLSERNALLMARDGGRVATLQRRSGPHSYELLAAAVPERLRAAVKGGGW